MGTYHKAYWESDGTGQTRRERKSGPYEYYLPTKLSDLEVSLDVDVVADVVRAESAIRELNGKVEYLHSSEGLARFLLRAESVSSSYIEGLQVGTRRLLKAELDLAGKSSFGSDKVAAEIIGNIHAMENALVQAESESRVSVDTIKAIHRTLLQGSRLEEYGGVLRDVQNWVGGNWHNPLQAKYIPPAPEYVDGLLEDLADFCNQELVSPVQQAALAHAQFETIHPFVDGNGRTGRALIHLILRRRGLTPMFVPPISLILATFSEAYIGGLVDYRFADDTDAKEIREGLNEWISFFAGACVRACKEASEFEAKAQDLRVQWMEKLGGVRKGSTVEVLLDEFVGMPVFTYKALCDVTGRSLPAVTDAVKAYEEVGIVKGIGRAQRKRGYEVPDVLATFNLLERQLASPSGDTRTEKPSRPVPFKAD